MYWNEGNNTPCVYFWVKYAFSAPWHSLLASSSGGMAFVLSSPTLSQNLVIPKESTFESKIDMQSKEGLKLTKANTVQCYSPARASINNEICIVMWHM